MADNVTPVVLKVKDFAEREVSRYRTWWTDHHPCEGPQ